jgi:hypothetical protein
MRVSLLAAIVIGLLFMPLYAQTPEPQEVDTAQQAVEPEATEEAGEPEQATEPEAVEEAGEVEEVVEAAPVFLLYRRCGKGTFIQRFFLQRRYRPDILLDKRLKRRRRRFGRACLVLQWGGKGPRGTARELCPQSCLELQENSSRVDR